MVADRTPKSSMPPPPKVPSSKRAVTNAIHAAMIAPALIVEQTVQAAAAELGITHKRLLTMMLDEAEAPYATGAERISAIAKLGDWIGTAKAPPTVHNHLHQHLANVPSERLEDRLARIIQDIPEEP